MIRFASLSYFHIYEGHLLDHKYRKTDCKIQITVKKNSNIVNIFSINRHSLQYRLLTQFFRDLSKAVGTTLPLSIPKFQSYLRERDGDFEFWFVCSYYCKFFVKKHFLLTSSSDV